MAQCMDVNDLSCGDVIMNSCDPDFLGLHAQNETSMQVFQMVAYGVFAERVIVPSRYLLAPQAVTFDAFKVLVGLLDAGVIVPDLRVGYGSFEEFVRKRRDANEEMFERACWLDANASAIYHFDVNGQSQLYRAHLINDMEPGVGLLARALSDAGVDERRILEARDRFWECGGNRRTFVRISSRWMPEQRELFSKWAAFRYYTTPAELEGAAIRDMPMPVSELIRREGVADPRRFFVRDARDTRANPPDCIHNVLMAIPAETESGDLWPLSDIVLKTRDKMSGGPAKFKHIAEQGFIDDVESTNRLFVEEVARESRRFPDTIGRRILSAVRSNSPLWMIGWLLGRSIPSPGDASLAFGLDEAFHAGGGAVRKELNPFTETAQYFGNQVRKAFG